MAAEPPQPRPQPPQRLLSNSTKRSLRSHSSSFEADDERSSSGDQESMGPEPDAGVHIRPQYPGEDTRLTSRKELAGWYAYGFAAEVFIICGMGEFAQFPVNLNMFQFKSQDVNYIAWQDPSFLSH
jgi:MFS transporter, UMF1 family